MQSSCACIFAIAKQVGMDRMSWEGLKRQRSVAMLMFETRMILLALLFGSCFVFIISVIGVFLFCFCLVPQVTLQSLLFFGIIDVKLVGIETSELVLSIVAALLNGIGQIWRLILESEAVEESLIEFCLYSVNGRVGWVPFVKKMELLNKDDSILKYNSDNPLEIDFKIKYDIPIITKYLHMQNSIEYDFSDVAIRYFYTICCVFFGSFSYPFLVVRFVFLLYSFVLCCFRQLVSVMSVLDTTSIKMNNNVDTEKNDSQSVLADETFYKSRLQVNFGKSLRLLSFQDIMMLLQVCVDKNINIPEIADINVIDFENAISNSVSQKKDCRLLEHACDARGRPYLMTFCDFNLPTRIHCLMMFELLECDLDINLVDYASGESVIFPLLRKYDYVTLRYLLTRHKEAKKIAIFLNYYNNQGISPLYLALSLYRKEKQLFSQFEVDDKKFMYQYLLEYGANPNDSLKKGEYITCLGYAMQEIKDPGVCDVFQFYFDFWCFCARIIELFLFFLFLFSVPLNFDR